MQIYALKLSTGEEVVGTSKSIIDENDEFINLSDVYGLEIKLTDGDYAQTLLKPFMIYSKIKLFTFPKKHVILYTPLQGDMVEYYINFVQAMKMAEVELEKSNSKLTLQ